MRFVLRFIIAGCSPPARLVFLIGVAAVAVIVWHYSKDLPDYAQLRNYEPPVMSRVHAGDGSLIAEYAKERRLYLPIQAVPKLVVNTFLAAEDKNFYTLRHMGIDPEGIGRAVYYAVMSRGSGRRLQGGSTITQQGRQELPGRRRALLRAQDPRGSRRDSHRGGLFQGQDP